MVKKTIIHLLLVLPFLLVLTSCDLLVELFSLSPFPGYLAQAVDAVDISGQISDFLDDEKDDWWSELFVLRRPSDKKDFVFLIVKKGYGGQRVYAFDDSVELKSYATIDHHNEIHLVEADGRFFVGDVHFDSVTLSPSPDNKYLWGHAFSNTAGTRNYLITGDGQQCLFEERNPGDWSTTGASQEPYVEFSAFGNINYNLSTIGFDPLLMEVYLFFYNWDEGYLRIIKTPEGDYLGGIPATGGYLIPDLPPYPYEFSPRIYDVREEYFWYTRKGMVTGAHDDGLLYLLTFNGERIDQLRVNNDHRMVIDFDIDGEFFYYFDELNSRLYKAVTGW